jgi:galactokinase
MAHGAGMHCTQLEGAIGGARVSGCKGGGMPVAWYQEQILDAVVNAKMKRMKKNQGMQSQQTVHRHIQPSQHTVGLPTTKSAYSLIQLTLLT